MAEMTLTKTRILAGAYEGVLTRSSGGEAPILDLIHLERPVGRVAVTPDPARPNVWRIEAAIPPETLSDGVQTFLITDQDTGRLLDSFTMVTGVPMEDDIRAEVALLRAELDMLKRAFRRHCLETME
jgi:hypothetical protein